MILVRHLRVAYQQQSRQAARGSARRYVDLSTTCTGSGSPPRTWPGTHDWGSQAGQHLASRGARRSSRHTPPRPRRLTMGVTKITYFCCVSEILRTTLTVCGKTHCDFCSRRSCRNTRAKTFTNLAELSLHIFVMFL